MVTEGRRASPEELTSRCRFGSVLLPYALADGREQVCSSPYRSLSPYASADGREQLQNSCLRPQLGSPQCWTERSFHPAAGVLLGWRPAWPGC